MSSFTRQQLEGWLKEIEVRADCRILDIGGSQKSLAGRLKNDLPAQGYKVMDLPKPHEKHHKVDYEHDINIRFDFPTGFERFDLIFMLEVMEYVWNPVEALKNCHRMLKEGGGLVLSTPFIYPVHNPAKEDCLRYTREGIVKLLQLSGFKINSIEPRLMKTPELWEAFVRNEGMKPANNVNHHAVGHLITAVR